MTSRETFEFSTTLNAPAQEVWDVLTRTGEPLLWLSNLQVDSPCEVGERWNYILVHPEETVMISEGVLREWRPPERLTVQGVSDDAAGVGHEVRYTLSEEAGRTRVEVRHVDVDTDDPAAQRLEVDEPHFLNRLKGQVETGEPPRSQVFVIDIDADVEHVWAEITRTDGIQTHYFQSRFETSFEVGSPISYRHPDAEHPFIAGEILEYEPSKRLVHTFEFHHRQDAPTRVTWEVAPREKGTRLTLIHEFDAITDTYQDVSSGWPAIVANLKSLVESGATLSVRAQSEEDPDAAEA